MEKMGAFIISHGRPHKVKTIRSLREAGYTGEIKIVIDDLDDTADEYKALYKDDVIVYDKLMSLAAADTMDNFGKIITIVGVRNECFKLAKQLEWKYFFEFDNDYTRYEIRSPKNGKLSTHKILNMDRIIGGMIELLESRDNILTVCLSQGGDFIGGVNNPYVYKKLSRKAMNCFLCKTDRPFEFRGTLNEDVNMYVRENMVGNIVLSSTQLGCCQGTTQKTKGGLTDIYMDVGTYTKSFYSVMIEPSCVKIAMMGDAARRIHHQIAWKNCAPKIINEKYRKAR